MARLTNAVRTLWSGIFETELDSLTSARSHSDYRYEGEVKMGSTLKIIGVTSPTIKTYVPGTDITREAVADSVQELVVDQFKYFNIDMEDVDKVQSEADIRFWAEQGAKGMTDKADAFVCGLAAGATGDQLSSKYEINPSTIVAELGKGFSRLYTNNVSPKSTLHLEVEPYFYGAMTEAITELNTSNSELIKEGYVGMYRGAKISIENQLHTGTVDAQLCHFNMLRTTKAIAYVEQLNSFEGYRPDGSFRDAMRALMVYGGKLVRPLELYVIASYVA